MKTWIRQSPEAQLLGLAIYEFKMSWEEALNLTPFQALFLAEWLKWYRRSGK